MNSIKQQLELIIQAKNQVGGALNDIQKDSEKALGDKPGGISALSTGAKVALGAATLAVGALAAGIGKSVQVAAEFETGMAKVKAITGATGKDFDSLRSKALEMGRTTQFSATESAEAIQFLGMAGFKTDQIIESLPATLNLAAAGAMDLGQAADISSNIMSGMGLKASDLGNIVDGLAQAARKSNTDVMQLGEAFKYVGPTAATLEIPFATTTALLGGLANAGLQASVGGTSLNSALRAMVKPTDEAGEALKRIGVTFTDSQGKMRPMEDILVDLEAANMSAKDAFTIFGSEGGRAINALLQQGAPALKELKAAIENSGGVAKEMADTQLATLEGSMKLLSSATEGLMIAVGDDLLPILASLLNDYVTPAISKFTEWIDAVGGLSVMFDDAVDLVAGFGETAWNIFDGLFSDSSFREAFLEGLIGMFKAGVLMYRNYLVNVGDVIWAGAELLWEPIKFAFGLLWEPIKSTAIEGLNAMLEAAETPINAVVSAINGIGETFGVTIQEIDFTPIENAATPIEERWENFKVKMGEKWDAVGAAASKMGDDLVTDAGEVADAAGEAFGAMETKASPKFTAVVAKYKEKTAEIIAESTTAGETAGKEIGTKIAEELNKEPTGAQEEQIRQGGIKGAVKWVSGWNEKLKEADGLPGAVVGGLEAVVEGGSFRQAVTGIATAIGTLVGGPVGAAIGQVTGKVLGTLSGIFGGEDKSENRKDVLQAVQKAIMHGDLAEFTGDKKLLSTLENTGSARLTLDAFMATFGLNETEAAQFIQFLTQGDKALRGDTGGLARWNERLGALDNRGLQRIAAMLVPGGGGGPIDGVPVGKTDKGGGADAAPLLSALERSVRAGGIGMTDLGNLRNGLNVGTLAAAMASTWSMSTQDAQTVAESVMAGNIYGTQGQALNNILFPIFGIGRNRTGGGVPEPPPEPDPEPTINPDYKRNLGLMKHMLEIGTVSTATLRAIGGDMGAILQDLSAMGVPHTGGTAAGIWNWIASGHSARSDQEELLKQFFNVDLVAAQGLDMVTSGPTRILAGERGRERVKIDPLTGDGTEFTGSAGPNYYFITNVYALDASNFDTVVERRIWPKVRELNQRASRRGVEVAQDTGISYREAI